MGLSERGGITGSENRSIAARNGGGDRGFIKKEFWGMIELLSGFLAGGRLHHCIHWSKFVTISKKGEFYCM